MKTTKEQPDKMLDMKIGDWIDTCSELDTALARVKVLEDALEKIKDGGVEFGVLANVHERMLVMCELATEALARSRALGETHD